MCAGTKTGTQTGAAWFASWIKKKWIKSGFRTKFSANHGKDKLVKLALVEFCDSNKIENFHRQMDGPSEACGPVCPITQRIKDILHQYDGSQLLSELLQNCDDAKATRAMFILDRRSFGSATVLTPEMARFQGPALVHWSNSIFAPENFDAIQRIGNGSKKFDPTKTGRFGPAARGPGPPSLLSALRVSHRKSVFVWGFCTGAQGA